MSNENKSMQHADRYKLATLLHALLTTLLSASYVERAMASSLQQLDNFIARQIASAFCRHVSIHTSFTNSTWQADP